MIAAARPQKTATGVRFNSPVRRGCVVCPISITCTVSVFPRYHVGRNSRARNAERTSLPRFPSRLSSRSRSISNGGKLFHCRSLMRPCAALPIVPPPLEEPSVTFFMRRRCRCTGFSGGRQRASAAFFDNSGSLVGPIPSRAVFFHSVRVSHDIDRLSRRPRRCRRSARDDRHSPRRGSHYRPGTKRNLVRVGRTDRRGSAAWAGNYQLARRTRCRRANPGHFSRRVSFRSQSPPDRP